MPKDLRTHLQTYESLHPEDVLRIEKPLRAEWECSAVAKKFDQRGEYPILIFERVINRYQRVSPIRVVANGFGDRQKIASALDTTWENAGKEWADRVSQAKRKPVVVPREEAPCKENVLIGDAVDLWEFPILRIHEMDPGPYLTAGMLTCYDPQTWTVNCAFHRGFIAGPREIRSYLTPGSHNAWNLKAHEELGEPMKVAYWIGHHPSVIMGAHTHMGYPEDHYETAGAVSGAPLRLVPSETLGPDFLVPADAEIIIEGIMRPGVRAPEGPFGEYPRYYGPQLMSPVIEVTAVTYRDNAIYDTHMVGMVHDYSGVQVENLVYEVLKKAVPQVTAVYLPRSGCGRFHVYVQMKKTHDGQPRAAIMACLAAFEWIKHVIVVDDDINVYDDAHVLWAVATRSQWDKDLLVIPDCFGSILDPSADWGARSAKGGIDATKPAAPRRYPHRLSIPDEVMARIQVEDLIDTEILRRRGWTPTQLRA